VNALSYEDDRYRSKESTNFLGFIDNLRSLWKAGGNQGDFVRYRPLNEISDFPRITYRLKKRVVNPYVKDVKPRRRSIINHPHDPNEFVELLGQRFDCYVEFDILSPSAEEADELAAKLEEYLFLYAGFFKEKGIVDIRFEEQGEDEVIQESRFFINKRPLIYLISFEKIYTVFLDELQDIAVKAKISSAENITKESIEED